MLKHHELTKNTEKAKEYFADKLAFTVGPVELKHMIETESDDIQIIDVRNTENYYDGHIPGAISMPAGKLEFETDELSKDQINIVYCYDQNCHLASRAARMLAEEGFPVMELEGGFEAWKDKDYDYESMA